MESMSGGMPSAGIEIAEPSMATPEISSPVEERSFSVDEKISLYNDNNNFADQTKNIASQFSDPEVSFKPAAELDVSSEERAFTTEEKSALGDVEAIDDTKSIAAQFSDPETSFAPAAPKAMESKTNPEQTQEKMAQDAENEKVVTEEKKIAAEHKAHEHGEKIETVREDIHAIYEGRSVRQSPAEIVRSLSSNEYAALSDTSSTENSPQGASGGTEGGEKENGGDDNRDSFERKNNTLDKNEFEKYIGAVMYHVEPGQSFAHAKIGLIKTDNGWTLPEGIASSHLSDKAQAEILVGEQTGVATNAGEKFEQTHSTMNVGGGSTIEMEGNYFVANASKAENGTTPDGKELKWFTVSELQNMSSLPNHVQALISKALPSIQAKVREAQA